MKISYFDNAATTCVSKSAADKAYEIMTGIYGNPSSVHAFGIKAAHELEEARKNVTHAMGFRESDGDLYFTSSGTEAANLAIMGYAHANSRKGKRIIASDSEHPCVYNALKALEKEGFEIIYIPTKGGRLDLDYIVPYLDENVLIISCMVVNNETGAVYDISALDKLRREKCPGAVLHTDAVQGFLKTEKCISNLCPGVDMVSVSSHKIHAPKGCGALWVRKGIRISPLIFGGGQERDIRPGTEALPCICAFGISAKEGMECAADNYKKVLELNNYTKEKITAKCGDDVKFNVPEVASPYILSLCIKGIRSEIMLRKLSESGIYVSAGSACSSKHRENRVLKAFGLSDSDADFTIRISFSSYNTFEEVDLLADAIEQGKKSIIPIKGFRR